MQRKTKIALIIGAAVVAVAAIAVVVYFVYMAYRKKKVLAVASDLQAANSNETRNLQAFLRAIRFAEGTADEAGYNRIFGGQLFTGYADHPNVKVPYRNTYSTAAGAYQFLYSTWKEEQRKLDLPDFSPENQDKAAVSRLEYRGALDDVLSGNFEEAVRKTAKEWASLPGSPYGQPTKSMTQLKQVYEANGGKYFELTA